MDDVGIDSIEMAVAMGVAMEAGVIPFGDGAAILRRGVPGPGGERTAG